MIPRPFAKRSTRAILTLGSIGALLLSPLATPASAVSRLSAPASGLPPNPESSGPSFLAALSADADYSLFISAAANLTLHDYPAQTAPWMNVFLRQQSSGTTELISVSYDKKRGGNGNSHSASFSGDARWVLFASAASDLIASDTNDASDIFLRDRASGETIALSTRGPAFDSATANGASTYPAMSPDARFIVFESAAQDITERDVNPGPDIFWIDRDTQTKRLVSLQVNSGARGSESFSPVVSPDGTKVYFLSAALAHPSIPQTAAHLFVHDVPTQSTAWISASLAAVSDNFVVSADGKTVAFIGQAPNRAASLFWRNLAESTNRVIASTSTLNPNQWFSVPDHGALAISANGSKVAFSARLSPPSPFRQIHLWDAATQTTSLISRNHDDTGPANHASSSPTLNASGARIGFLSLATDLISSSPPVSGHWQGYVRDTATQLLRSAPPAPASPNEPDPEPAFPALSADGASLGFSSSAPGLAPDDLKNTMDAFAVLLDFPSWPTSIQLALSLDPVASQLRIRFQVPTPLPSPAPSYKLQTKQRLDESSWMDIPAAPTWQGSEGSFVLSLPSAPAAFYRLILKPSP